MNVSFDLQPGRSYRLLKIREEEVTEFDFLPYDQSEEYIFSIKFGGVPGPPVPWAKEFTDHRRVLYMFLAIERGKLFGNWAESSNANTGLKAIPSNIHHKKFVVNVRHDFHLSSSFPDNRIFSVEKMQNRFPFVISYLPLPEQYQRMVHWPKARTFFGPKVSHFLKVRTLFGLSCSFC